MIESGGGTMVNVASVNAFFQAGPRGPQWDISTLPN
jgi:hypothetical protein